MFSILYYDPVHTSVQLGILCNLSKWKMWQTSSFLYFSHKHLSKTKILMCGYKGKQDSKEHNDFISNVACFYK